MNLRLAGYGPAEGADFFHRLDQRVAGLPGVVAVSRALAEPLAANSFVRDVGLPGDPANIQVMNAVVSPGHLAVLRTPIVEGRDFDRQAPAGSVIVSQALAHRLWPGKSAVGRALEARDNRSAISTVIGVARDSKFESLEEEAAAILYTQLADDYSSTQVIFARTSGDPRAVLAGLRQAIRQMDRHVPILALTTLEDHVTSTLAASRAAAWLVVVLAGLAAVIAALGIHGVVSFAAWTRRRDIAIRTAIGATPWQIARWLGARYAWAVAGGLVVGLSAALGVQRFVRSLLYQVRAADPWVLALTASITIAVSVLAAVGPTAAAIATDPARTLRE